MTFKGKSYKAWKAADAAVYAAAAVKRRAEKAFDAAFAARRAIGLALQLAEYRKHEVRRRKERKTP